MRAATPAINGQAVDFRRQSGRPPMKANETIARGESVVKSIEDTGVYTHRDAAGTAPAIIDITLGATAFSDEAQPCGWGGARNSSSRTSEALTVEQTAQIIEAAQFAWRIGVPLNRHVTIHWQAAGVPDCRAAAATAAFLTLARDWLRKRGARFAWAWVRENGDGKGSHVHILIHCPPEMARPFSAMQRGWLRRITGKPYRARTIRTARIGGTLNAANLTPAAYDENLANVVGYLLKGASPDAARMLGTTPLEAGGSIIGKRAATSQNIGRAARKKAIR